MEAKRSFPWVISTGVYIEPRRLQVPDMGWSRYIAEQEAMVEFEQWMNQCAVFLRYPWDLSPEMIDDAQWELMFKENLSPLTAVEAVLKDLLIAHLDR